MYNTQTRTYTLRPHSESSHPGVTPAILAGEGFHFCPTAQDPDTVICFFCDLQVSRVCTCVSPGISWVFMCLRVSHVCSYVSPGISCVYVCVDQCLLLRHFTCSLLLRDWVSFTALFCGSVLISALYSCSVPPSPWQLGVV